MIPRGVLDRVSAVRDWAILRAYRGSIAHGMYVPSKDPLSVDDKDVLAVCVPPLNFYFGQSDMGSRGTVESFVDEWDIVAYEARKFVGLLAKGNPNVLSALWLDRQYIMHSTPAWNFLVMNRDAFVGKHVYHSFSGYAYSQLHKMTRFEYGGYLGQKRKQLVDRFGYDCKNAAHLIRLLRMGCEFLQEGRMHVLREDASELLSIKRGEWTLERVKAEAEEWFKRIRDAKESCQFPDAPDRARVDRICTEMVLCELDRRGAIPRGANVFNLGEAKRDD